MTNSATTPEQRRLMKHALGVADNNKTPYRNRFATYLGSDATENWIDLARRGLAEHWDTSDTGMMFFAVTLAGHAAIGVTPED